MVISLKEGLHLTYNSGLVAEHLQDGGTAIISFGDSPNSTYGWFCVNKQKSIRELARQKGRSETKAFVRTSDRKRASRLLNNEFIHPAVSDYIRAKVSDLFQHGKSEYAIGVLLPARQDGHGQNNVGSIKIADRQIYTVGLMVSGEDISFSSVIDHISEGVIVGTSMNPSNDMLAGGSGHHSLRRGVDQFVRTLPKDARVAVMMPKDHVSRQGVSTSVAMIDLDGKAYIARHGSMPKKILVEKLTTAGFEFAGEIDNCPNISPYKYQDSQGERDAADIELIEQVRLSSSGVVHVALEN